MTGILQVSTTTDSHAAAVELASSAVRECLAASAEVHGPVTSFFWHLDEFGVAEEWQLTLKTTVERYPELEAHLIADRSWRKPEVTAVEVASGSEAYLNWVRDSVSSPASSPAATA